MPFRTEQFLWKSVNRLKLPGIFQQQESRRSCNTIELGLVEGFKDTTTFTQSQADGVEMIS